MVFPECKDDDNISISCDYNPNSSPPVDNQYVWKDSKQMEKQIHIKSLAPVNEINK